MSDSKKLPTIEVGDTVVFRTDLKVGKYYDHLSFKRSMVKHLGQSRAVQQLSDTTAFYIGDGFWYSEEMVSKVLKPSKARVYSESAMELAFHCGTLYQGREGDTDFKTFIQTLNTEGK